MLKNYDDRQEKELVLRAQQDPEAFRQIYRQYFPRIYAFVGYYARRAQDIEDIVAETFLRIVERIDRFEWRGNGSFSAWVFRIARNIVYDSYRRTQLSRESVPLEDLPEIAADRLLPADIVAQKEKFMYLRELIETLSPRRKEILMLKFFGGLRNCEIAEMLHLDERTVAAHLCRGVKDLHGKHLNKFPDQGRKGK